MDHVEKMHHDQEHELIFQQDMVEMKIDKILIQVILNKKMLIVILIHM